MSDAPGPRWLTALTALAVAGSAVAVLVYLLYQWSWIGTP